MSLDRKPRIRHCRMTQTVAAGFMVSMAKMGCCSPFGASPSVALAETHRATEAASDLSAVSCSQRLTAFR